MWEGAVDGPVVEELVDQGVGVSYHLFQCLGYFIYLLIKGQKFCEDVHIWGSTERKGGNY